MLSLTACSVVDEVKYQAKGGRQPEIRSIGIVVQYYDSTKQVTDEIQADTGTLTVTLLKYGTTGLDTVQTKTFKLGPSDIKAEFIGLDSAVYRLEFKDPRWSDFRDSLNLRQVSSSGGNIYARNFTFIYSPRISYPALVAASPTPNGDFRWTGTWIIDSGEVPERNLHSYPGLWIDSLGHVYGMGKDSTALRIDSTAFRGSLLYADTLFKPWTLETDSMDLFLPMDAPNKLHVNGIDYHRPPSDATLTDSTLTL